MNITANVLLTIRDVRNLQDALREWYDVVGTKELEDDEDGLNYDRYVNLMEKLQRAEKEDFND